MVATYLDAIDTARESAKGLTTTHQGGEAYVVDAFKQLRRFLILGTEGGTFYVNEKAITNFNIKAVTNALNIDGMRAVDEIVDVSDRGLAPKNDPALLALAMAASYQHEDKPAYAESVRSYALSVLPKVARTGTHLFHFAAYVDKLRGWGSGLRKGVARWYLEKSPMALANQVTKYQQRDGWAHADLLRLAHPQPQNVTQSAIFKYVVDGVLPEGSLTEQALVYLRAVEFVKNESDIDEIVRMIENYNLPREVLPTQALNDKRVWEGLLYSGKGMPFTAMLRNLGTMSKVGLLTQGSDAARFVMDRLEDETAIKSARIHPLDVLKAKLTYSAGKGVRSDATWNAVNGVVEALEGAFYLAFGNVEPTGKRGLLALDVSGSMTWGEHKYYHDMTREGLAGIPGLSPRIAASVLCMVTARKERDFEIMGFTHKLSDLKISRHDSLETVMSKTEASEFGGTDCRLPFQYAMDNNRLLDYVAVYTDNETGYSNPSATMKLYRKKSGIHDAKLIVNGMTANQFSIADPTDPNMLDVVGFDSSAPQVMSAFIRGEV